jgi:O-antigen biosynthesis protein WbqP
MYKSFWKRVIDVVISFCGLVVLLIPMGIIAILIRIDSPGSALFKQKREGYKRKTFTVNKFRTMCDHAYEKGGIATSETDNRITKVGKVLRRTSMDEFPQLINILKGEMSIIGPRPILDWEFDENNNKPEYIKRFDVRPGLFCTVDLEHRNADRDLQFQMDAEYAEKCSLALDVATFFKVIKTVVTGKGVYKDEK